MYLIPNFEESRRGHTQSGSPPTLIAQLRNRTCLLIEDDPYGRLRYSGEDCQD